MYEVVLLQVATAKCDVPCHLQQLPHWQRRGLTLEMVQLQWHTQTLWYIQVCYRHIQLAVCSVSGSSSCLPQSWAPAGWSVAKCSDWPRCSAQCSHGWICCAENAEQWKSRNSCQETNSFFVCVLHHTEKLNLKRFQKTGLNILFGIIWVKLTLVKIDMYYSC